MTLSIVMSTGSFGRGAFLVSFGQGRLRVLRPLCSAAQTGPDLNERKRSRAIGVLFGGFGLKIERAIGVPLGVHLKPTPTRA